MSSREGPNPRGGALTDPLDNARARRRGRQGPALPAGKRGRPRTYGESVIDLAKRGGQRRGWSSDTFELYGEQVVKKYKTFLATCGRPAGRSGWF